LLDDAICVSALASSSSPSVAPAAPSSDHSTELPSVPAPALAFSTGENQVNRAPRLTTLLPTPLELHKNSELQPLAQNTVASKNLQDIFTPNEVIDAFISQIHSTLRLNSSSETSRWLVLPIDAHKCKDNSGLPKPFSQWACQLSVSIDRVSRILFPIQSETNHLWTLL
jgi:hypothetical protein